MIIYYKCSFRAGHGFRIGKYDTDIKELRYISEKSNEIKKALPEVIEYTLSNQLGHCLMFATDENGNYFFGAYRLIEGNDDKYVNAVFFDSENPTKVFAAYKYFCKNPKRAEKYMLDSIQRTDEQHYQKTHLEFQIEEKIIDKLLKNMHTDCLEKEMKKTVPNSLIAFITADQYQDYQVVVEDRFSVDQLFLHESYNVDKEEQIRDYQTVSSRLFKENVLEEVSSVVAIAIWYIALIGLLVLSFLILF